MALKTYVDSDDFHTHPVPEQFPQMAYVQSSLSVPEQKRHLTAITEICVTEA